jgi:LacI family transcriptional regulator
MRLVFLLPAGTNRYLNMLGDYVDVAREQLEPFNVQCRCRYIEGFNPQVLVDNLLREGRRADGIASWRWSTLWFGKPSIHWPKRMSTRLH